MAYTQPIFVKSAQISAHLHFATEVAKNISLTSKNARAITVRAGQKAAGFVAITQFIEELSKITIERSENINKIAVKVSQIATEQQRTQAAQHDFNKVYERAAEAPYVDSISKAKNRTTKLIKHYHQEFNQLLRDLENELEESQKQIRTADMLVSTSKIEAAQVGEYQRSFEVIAENLFDAAGEIRKELSQASKILQQALSQLNESH